MLTVINALLISQWKTVLAVTIACPLMVGIYNVTLHPLAGIPGYSLAGFTRYYETVWCFYQARSIYYQKVHDMHKKYGPIVRVSPNEVSLSEPNDAETIYNIRSPYDKHHVFYRSFGVSHGMFSETNHGRHRSLRAPWNQYFSKRMVRRLQPMVLGKIRKMCQKLAQDLEANSSARVQELLHATMIDIVSEYTLPECLDLLDEPQRASGYIATLFDQAGMTWILMANPAMFYLGRLLSTLRGRILGGPLEQLFESSRKAASPCYRAHKPRFSPLQKPLALEVKDGELSKKKKVSEKVLIDETYSFNVAAAFNFGTTVSVVLYHALSSKCLHRRLLVELEAFQYLPEDMARSLPFLTACIKEGLRLGYGPIGRLPRIVPPSGECFQGYHIPAGTVVGVWNYVYHHNESIWGEDHRVFNPDRWLDPDKGRGLDRHLLTFGRDSFQCIGKDLALQAIYIALFELLTTFKDLCVAGDCDFEDLDDHFAATIPKNGSKLIVCRSSGS